MPIFEYQCKSCNTRFEILHKSSNNSDEVVCPNCNSKEHKKLLSTFSASVSGSYSKAFESPCAGGQCPAANPYTGGCANGMCGLD